MTIRYQYPGLFEPVSTSPETTVVDKWYRPLSEPVRIRPQPIRTDYHFFVDFTVPVVEAVTVDSWFRPLSEPVRARAQLPGVIYNFLTELDLVVETVTLDKWFRETSIPLYGVPRNNAYYPVVSFLDIEEVAQVFIDGASTVTLSSQYDTIMVVSDNNGNSWWILAQI